MPLPKNLPRPSFGDPKQTKAVPSAVTQPVQNAKRMLANRYQVEKRLGQGNFGTAWLVSDRKCKDAKDKMKVIKEISVGDLLPDETVDAMHEANLLSKMDHPNIVKFHDSFIEGDYFCLVTEYCEGGDLDKIILDYRKNKKNIPEPLVVEWLIQLLLAVQYMHSRRIMHRDLKTRNIFLKGNRVKIGDFGISRILMSNSDMASTFTGTPYYMSPEVLKHEGYNSKSDVWSVGCMLYELVAKIHAFEGQSLMGVMYKIVEGNLPEWPSCYSKDLEKVFGRLLEKDPSKRPSAAEALTIPFIKGQLQALADTMMDKHAAKANIHSINKDTNDIANALKQKTHLDRLREESEEQRLKNMSPREKARLRKQQEADKKARLMSAATRQQYRENTNKYQNIKKSQNAYKANVPPWLRGKAQKDLQEAENCDDLETNCVEGNEFYYDDEADTLVCDNNNQQFNKHSTMPDRQVPSNWDQLPIKHMTVASDDRPITPLKNRMIYDPKNSTLDFEDGIPETEELAATYYSQFDEEFEDGTGSDSDDNEGTLLATVKDSRSKGVSSSKINTNDGMSSESSNNMESAGDEEMRVFITCMQNALDKNETFGMQTLTDDTITDAYGPTFRDKKIVKMREECERKMGKKDFDSAYNYLKMARFGDKANEKTIDENEIMKDLKKMIKDTNDCFMVDQLLFLEEQQKLCT